ncbi:MAG: PEP/pyruvate-binding domain-containing protein [Candidatus Hodarchaeales archaeon]|jgi:pyruvate,water dikinase
MYQSQPILKLSEVDYARADTFGDRACSLSRLMARGYHIPKGIVISTKVFKRYLNTAPGTKRIDQLIEQVTPATIAETAQEIQDLINFSPVPMQMANQMATAISSLLDKSPSQALIVRTSANVEGSSRHVCSGRGVHFHMNDITQIIRVVKNCWASAYTADVLKDLISAGLPPDSVWVAVIVEKMVQAEVSGKMYIEESDKDEKVHIEANWGAQVHQAEEGVLCDHIIIDPSETKIGEPIETFNAYKQKISHISPENHQLEIIENDPARKTILSLDPEKISTLAQLARKIHDDFEVGYMIEFVFDENGTLWLLDAVPLSIHKNLYKIGETSTITTM